MKTRLIPMDEDDGTFVRCERCGVRFSVWWHRQIGVDRVAYCPFCGTEVETGTDHES